MTRKKKTIVFPPIEQFNMPAQTPKAQALKVLEEAAELVEAVKDSKDNIRAKHTAIEEFCDVLQALGNLADQMEWKAGDLEYAYYLVHQKNKERGWY